MVNFSDHRPFDKITVILHALLTVSMPNISSSYNDLVLFTLHMHVNRGPLNIHFSWNVQFIHYSYPGFNGPK